MSPLLMDAVADGRIERPMTAWYCCLEFYSVTTRLPEEYRLVSEIEAASSSATASASVCSS